MANSSREDARVCSVCGARFEPQYKYQLQSLAAGRRYYCSQGCMIADVTMSPEQNCSVCGRRFTVEFAFQVSMNKDGATFYCSDACRMPDKINAIKKERGTRRIAALNQKGGTGKTSTAVNLAAAFAARGHRVLLVDFDPQGNVGVSLGVRSEKAAYRLLFGKEERIEELAVPIRDGLDIITSDETLAQGDMELVNVPDGQFVLRNRLRAMDGDYDYVILDCGPSLSMLNRNALCYADEVVIPVSCDYLALVGVKQVLKTIDDVEKNYGHKLSITGVIPTFFDTRNKISHEVVRNLQNRFAERVLPAVRINSKIKEAPIYKKTIFEYDPQSRGAEDYLAIAAALLGK